ncbi:hypothetical protein BCR32DRAFT_297786 [Anaeromyces robustus]|uniref:Uncharacterized protein n=1 Tax=Anaeromyces robustus TaxID=1754192 RepID=A0A1Y1VVC4_9FUNG|nr:hypothetical protein BCR32DRAFT_297786 [Anaeromyces robustus]|eukprot:ORX65232.1 hypothetical protein BCR32DRAFT_297786 [Anaeromyces robustus]
MFPTLNVLQNMMELNCKLIEVTDNNCAGDDADGIVKTQLTQGFSIKDGNAILSKETTPRSPKYRYTDNTFKVYEDVKDVCKAGNTIYEFKYYPLDNGTPYYVQKPRKNNGNKTKTIGAYSEARSKRRRYRSVRANLNVPAVNTTVAEQWYPLRNSLHTYMELRGSTVTTSTFIIDITVNQSRNDLE